MFNIYIYLYIYYKLCTQGTQQPKSNITKLIKSPEKVKKINSTNNKQKSTRLSKKYIYIKY